MRIGLIISVLFLMTCTEQEATKSKDDVNVSLINNPVTLDDTDSTQMPKIQFEEDFYTFGELVQGEVVEHRFKFKNTATAPLLISEARASCGCTVPKWPKEPIMPGQEKSIRIKFDSKGKQGSFRKTITIHANTHPSMNIITITGNIIIN